MKWDDIKPTTKKWEDIQAPETPDIPAEPEETTARGIAESIPEEVYAAMGGINTLFPAIAGLPVDTATNVANLLISGYGMGRQVVGRTLLGETPAEAAAAAPEVMPPQPGGSEWIKEKITGVMGADPFSPPDPTDPLQRKIHMASSIIGAGALAPSAGIRQTVAQMGRMVTPAAGAVTAETLMPEQPLAPMVGMLAAPGAVSGARAVTAKVAPKISASKAFMKAHKLGYKVPPALAKPTKTQQFAEGVAGPVPTKQKASIENQKITNRLIKKEIDYPKDIPLSREGLDNVRTQAGEIYKQAKQFGALKVDKTFNSQVNRIAQQGSALAKEFPQMVKKDIVDMTQAFAGKKQISSEALVDVVKQLRADSNVGFRSQDPNTLAMARAQGKMANALEGLMERNLKNISPDFVKTFNNARQRIAKTYTVENALKGENVDAVALGRQLDKGKPLSGAIKDVAEFGQHFKGAAQVSPPQQTNFRPMDVITGVTAAVAGQNPAYLLVMGARPAIRTTLLSKPYQKMMAAVKPEAIRKVLKLPEEAQAGAIAALLDEFKGLESELQSNSQ